MLIYCQLDPKEQKSSVKFAKKNLTRRQALGNREMGNRYPLLLLTDEVQLCANLREQKQSMNMTLKKVEFTNPTMHLSHFPQYAI